MTPPDLVRPREALWPDTVLGAATAALGILEVATVDTIGRGTTGQRLVLVAGLAVAAGLYRRSPAVALALCWAVGLFQMATRQDFALVELAMLLVAYGAARYGSRASIWLSGLSLPVGAGLALAYARHEGTSLAFRLPFTQVLESTSARHAVGTRLGTAFVLVTAVLAAPWMLGLLLRLDERYRASDVDRRRAEAEAARAQEMAELRAGQATLARDVHDIVGHSLAVIVAQADSAQYLRDDEIDRVRQAMATIAASARQSLGDVRQVLSRLEDAPTGTGPVRGLDSLLDGIRDTGHDLRSEVSGVPRPLDEERGVVAYRVLQEMLTNALRHGQNGTTIDVHREWTDSALLLAVRNRTAGPVGTRGGRGLDGMQQRLEAVGGRLDVRRSDDREGGEFIASARIPLATP